MLWLNYGVMLATLVCAVINSIIIFDKNSNKKYSKFVRINSLICFIVGTLGFIYTIYWQIMYIIIR